MTPYPGHLSKQCTLASGEVLLLRPIRHDDDEREEAFVRALLPESGYQRLFSRGVKITPEWIEQMTHVDYLRHMAFVATTTEEGIERFAGVGRYVVNPETQSAEFALVIADAWQGKGLGHKLLETLIAHAKEARLQALEGIVLATNKAMLRLALSLGFGLRAEPGDATVVRVRLDLIGASLQR